MRAYVGHFTASAREGLRYFFSDSLLGSLGILGFIGVTLLFWHAIGQESFFGVYSWGAIAWYLIFAQIVKANQADIIGDVNRHVQSGTITNFLSKPFHYPLSMLSSHLGESFVQVLALLPFTVPLGLLVGGFILSLGGVAAGIAAGILAIVLDFLISLCIGLVAFWTEDASPYRWIYSKTLMVFGGLLFPLDVLPRTLQRVAELLPTAYLIYYPARLFVDFSWGLLWRVLAGQAAYLILFSLLAWGVYRAAIRRVGINGG